MLNNEAHKYLMQNGCLSLSQKYTAFEIEKMLSDFARLQMQKSNTQCADDVSILIEALSFIELASAEYNTYYSIAYGNTKKISGIIDGLRAFINKYE